VGVMLFSGLRLAIHPSIEGPHRELLIAVVLSHGASFFPPAPDDVEAACLRPAQPNFPTHIICSGPGASELLRLASCIGPRPLHVEHFWLVTVAWIDDCLAAKKIVPESDYGSQIPKTWIAPNRDFLGLRICFWPEDDVEPANNEQAEAARASGERRDTLRMAVEGMGATVVAASHDCDLHIARCRSHLPEELRHQNNTFSLLWLKDSIVHGGPVPAVLQPLVYRPVPGSQGISGLSDAVISISGPRGNERLYAVRMVMLTGARYAPVLHEATTHLIAVHPSGKKYDRALDMGIGVASKRWLEECIAQWTSLPVEYFPVE